MFSLIMFLILILIFWVAPILFARRMGKTMNKPNAWLWALFLGWLGVFVLLFQMPGSIRRAAVRRWRIGSVY